MGKYEDLERLQKLKEDGILTEEEFNVEKQKILNVENNTEIVEDASKNNINSNDKDIEIKGNFPLVQSKIPLELLEEEKVIIQHTFCNYRNATGIVTLTNKRILFNKSKGKTTLITGLIGLAATSGIKNLSIKLSQIVSIETPKATMGMGVIKITTNDGYTHSISMHGKTTMHKDGIEARDKIAELIKNVIN